MIERSDKGSSRVREKNGLGTMASATVTTSDELMVRLRQIAEERGVTLDAVIEQALEDWTRGIRRKPRSFGMGHSGFPDTSILAGEKMPEPDSWRS